MTDTDKRPSRATSPYLLTYWHGPAEKADTEPKFFHTSPHDTLDSLLSEMNFMKSRPLEYVDVRAWVAVSL